MARALNVDRQKLRRSLLGKPSKPDLDLLHSIASEGGFNLDWLISGQGVVFDNEGREALAVRESSPEPYASSRRPEGIPDDLDLSTTTFVPILSAPAGAASEGEGNAEDITVMAYSALPTEYLQQEVHIDPARAFILIVRGHSMEDVLLDGDMVLGERMEALDHDGVMAFVYNYGLYIKHLHRRQRLPTLMISENARYPAEEIDPELPFYLLGRIVRRLTRL